MERLAHRVWGATAGLTGVLQTRFARAFALVAMVALGGSELGAVSASTAPGGFVRATVDAGSATRHGTSLVASPLLNAPAFAGRVGSARTVGNTSTIKADSASGLRPSCIDATTPHAVFVTSGDFAGFVFRVLETSRDTITVDGQGFDLGRVLEPGETFDVRPIHTLATLFGNDATSVAFTAAGDASRADQLLVQRNGTWRAYWFTGSRWRQSGSARDAGDDVILPNEGIVIYRRSTTALDLRFVGEAPAQDAVLSMPAGAVSTVANPFPIDVAIGELGLETVAGWQCGARMEQADQVQLCVANRWVTFWHDGSRWTSSASSNAADTIPAGAAFLVVRRPTGTDNPFALVARPYDL